jgi:hypothetical protein
MKKFLFLIVGLAFLLSGCGEPAQKMHTVADFAHDIYQPALNCGFGSLVKPTNLSPGGEGVVTEANPTLSWDFSGCDVSSFTINMAADTPSFGLGNIIHEDVSEYTRHLAFTYDYLQDCTTYYWYIRAWGYTEYASNIASFHTDFNGTCPAVSTCTEAPSKPILVAPSQMYLSISNPQLLWIDSDPTCVAANYHYEVSRTPDFSDIVLDGDTTLHSYDPTSSYLDTDCTNYFWRVTAEANGYSITSDVMQFGTQFTGMCAHRLCGGTDVNELTKPTLISPPNGSTVTDPTPQFVWDDNLDTCWPGTFYIMVENPENFHDSLWHVSGGSTLTWTPLDAESLNNCTLYEWQVDANSEEGYARADSDRWSFFTDFGNTICGVSGFHIPIELVQSFDLGCVSASRMWAIYEFKGPVVGDFEVHIGSKSWPCELMEGYNNKLVCYGPLVTQQMETPVELFPVGSEEPALTEQGFTPQCVGVAICQPPAEGCSPQRASDVFGAPVYIPTHWDQNQCDCVP